MENAASPVEQHYYRPGLYDEIVSRLTSLQVDLQNVQRTDIAGVDEFHVRGAEVSKELAQTAQIRSARVLDVGCGIGGPCRMLADEFDCETVGIDLSEEFIRTATRLSELVGLADKTEFVQGDATYLPFEDQSFEMVWTQHVQMNIADGRAFYSEIARVLADGGQFLYYDIFRKGDQDPDFPVPWAEEPKISFLRPVSEMEQILASLNLEKKQSTDQTERGIAFFENLLRKIEEHGPPALGLNVLMGASTKTKVTNLLHALKDGRLELQSGRYLK